ncbi:MAG: glycoside hydrolase family 130 protein [Marinilabiliaceae bacterium]|nr:glycoside hydrolase family 130 protein [Marinilabiliaceae bacterium]
MKLSVDRKPQKITPDFKRVFARFFFFGEERALGIIQKVLDMSDSKVERLVKDILRDFSRRHRRVSGLFLHHYEKISYLIQQLELDPKEISQWKQLLIGSYFTMEYSLESAAIFNPSIVEDPNQDGLSEDQKRVIISFRATGEGHISSLVFRRGLITGNNIHLSKTGVFVDEAEVVLGGTYKKSQFQNILTQMNITDELSHPILKSLPEKFSYKALKPIIEKFQLDNNLSVEQERTLNEILWIAESYTNIKFSLDTDLSERVIFPLSKFEMKGIEDARFVKFYHEDGAESYFGTYTAYDGFNIMPKLIETKDFYNFSIRPLHGQYAIDKNLALFPRRVNGKYIMISRIDGVNTYIMYSDQICCWDNAKILLRPEYAWELVQIGNGGSPIETKHGWLLITHGVGPVRKYCLGAYLLDLDNPEKVIGRLEEPLLIPTEEEREGYVPNVVYTCGAYLFNKNLFIPYAMSDYASAFVSVNIDDLIQKIMENPR